MKKVPIASLVFDYSLYPRGEKMDSHEVSYMVDALEAGAKLPPILVEKKSNRVVDGFTRSTAFQKLYGDEATIDAVFRDYASDKELFADVMRYNSAHGKKLDRHDYVRCLLIGQKLGLKFDTIATSLNLTAAALKSLKDMKTARSNGFTVPLKKPIEHMRGRRLTQRQLEANNRLGGMQQTFYVNQIIELIEAELLDRKNENLMERLKHLGKLIRQL